MITYKAVVGITIVAILSTLAVAVHAVINLNTAVVEVCAFAGVVLFAAASFEAGFYLGSLFGIANPTIACNGKNPKTLIPAPEAASPAIVEPDPIQEMEYHANKAHCTAASPSKHMQNHRNISIQETASQAKPLPNQTGQSKLGSNHQLQARHTPIQAPENRKSSDTHFSWLCESAIFSADEKKFVEERGEELNNFVRGKKTSSDFHKLLESIFSGEVEAATPAQCAWEKYIVRCDAEQPREVTFEEGFAGSRDAIQKMREERSRSRFYWHC